MGCWAVIVAGGSGTRFWPLSTPALPKQFLPLTGAEPLLRQAAARLDGVVPADQVVIVTGAALADATRRLLPALPPENVLAEPRAASTGPALAWATAHVHARDPDAALLSLHADWWVGDDERFRHTARRALDVAERRDVLVTVGIVPTRPDVGYGYIERGEEVEPGVFAVARFTEKPDAARAADLVTHGALWNSGLFAWTAGRFAQETVAHAPEIADALPALDAGDVDRFFATVTPIAVDRSHFERSRRVAVLPGDFPWDDVGTWGALGRVRAEDAAGNVAVGAALVRDCTRTVVWSDGAPVVVDGLDEVVVVHAHGRTLVTTRDRAAHLKQLLETLPVEVRDIPDESHA